MKKNFDSAKKINIGGITIGDGHPCLVIPEGCDNHMGSVERAKEMASAAKEAGAKIIKWQLHIADEEMVKNDAISASKDLLKKWGSIWDYVSKFSLSVEDHVELKKYCEKIGIQYFCTPFSLKAAQILAEMGVDGLKIGSGENDDLLMIEGAAKLGKPMIVSTGMVETADLDQTVEAIKRCKTPLALAHCMSLYSEQKIEQLNYGNITLLKQRYGVPVGLSDHTPPESIHSNGSIASNESRTWAAVHRGANFIEKHFTLDRNQPDADSGFSLNPKDLKNLISTVNTAEKAGIADRKVFEDEKPVEIWAKRSLVSISDIAKGTTLKKTHFTSKRPGTGIRSKDYKKVLGKKTKNFIPKNTIIKWSAIN